MINRYQDGLDGMFKKYDDEFIQFERIEKKRSNRPDLHAFLLLEELCPTDNNRKMICHAEHDIFYLDCDLGKFCEVATEDHVLELIRCGVMLGDDGFEMFS